jgi:hypothetical protein
MGSSFVPAISFWPIASLALSTGRTSAWTFKDGEKKGRNSFLPQGFQAPAGSVRD